MSEVVVVVVVVLVALALAAVVVAEVVMVLPRHGHGCILREDTEREREACPSAKTAPPDQEVQLLSWQQY